MVLSAEAGEMEIHLCWKLADGSIRLYSSSSKKSKSRTAWDYIRDCVFKRTRNEREKIKNEFSFDELNLSLWKLK